MITEDSMTMMMYSDFPGITNFYKEARLSLFVIYALFHTFLKTL